MFNKNKIKIVLIAVVIIMSILLIILVYKGLIQFNQYGKTNTNTVTNNSTSSSSNDEIDKDLKIIEKNDKDIDSIINESPN